MWRARFALLLALGACTEQVTAPGACPDYCPGGSISVVDTIFDAIERDSAFSGYLNASEGVALPVADLPGTVDSRAIFRLSGIPDRVRNRAGDSTTVPTTLDSARLRLEIVHRDTGTTNLWFKLYRMPVAIDTTTTFADLVPAFTDSILDSVNVSALLTLPPISDTATVRIWGGTIQTDSAGHVLVTDADSNLVLWIALDSAQARYVAADTGRVAYGVRVSADTLASISLGANEGSRGPAITWFFNYPDTSAVPRDTSVNRGAPFDSFVFDPPTPPIDSNLAVGGVPAARSLLRVVIPPQLRDSADVVRATLILVPVGPVPGARADSFSVLARPVVADLGAKSPLGINSAFFGVETVRLNSSDTIRIEMTNLIRSWAVDTSATTAFVLSQAPEAGSYTQIRFFSTRAPAFRPALHVTYVRRYAFGTP
jgi:hypothetical protein